jgi:DNA replication ATP-dependent helicase Dna2
MGEMIRVPLIRDEVRSLVTTRNELAQYASQRDVLPPMLQNLHACQRCFSLDACVTYHKVIHIFNRFTDCLGAGRRNSRVEWIGGVV